MIVCPTVRQRDIRTHYNLSTLFYRLLWGRHIHHGLWSGDESASVAQQQLTETLAREAGIRDGERVLDVGCGMGSSSIHLASKLDCQVTGVTISAVQRRWAQCAAGWHGVARQARFLCDDAEQVAFPPSSFDVVWSIECTEHLFNKSRFFRRASTWLRPGGRVAICAWLAANTENREAALRVHRVCEGFFCPSLGTVEDYQRWFTAAGLTHCRFLDWTSAVTRTWEICRDRVRRTGVRWLARAVDRNQVMFLDRFEAILQAYQTGAMQYGCFIAERP
ncbi:MAG TPA: class I SAM-dependent methyltransferase [Pirellulales bacterium]|nr:class I SAM-dependent methyltransferase [Pirellulales bacterium]